MVPALFVQFESTSSLVMFSFDSLSADDDWLCAALILTGLEFSSAFSDEVTACELSPPALLSQVSLLVIC